MRGVRFAGDAAAGLVAVLVAVQVVAVGVVAPAWADTTTLPGSLSTVAEQTGPLTVAVPPGTTPTAVTGVLATPAVVDGAATTILVNGREALTVPSALYARVSVPLLPGDVVADGTLALTLRYDAPPDATGCAPAPAITLRKLGLDYTGTETPPTSVATFFPADASRIDVQVPRDSSDDVLQAAFNAVAALSHRYPLDTPVVLSAADTPLPTTGAAQRIVRIVGAGGAVSTAIDTTGPVPALVLSGAGLPLSDAARTLGTDDLGLAGAGGTTGLSRQIESRDDGLTRSIEQLRDDSPGAATSAPGTEVVEIRQDSFGTPVSSLAVHLEGTHSAVPAGAAARLDVYLDDRLVGSSVIGADPAIDLDLTVPGSILRSAGLLRATVHSLADPTQACSPGLPLELSLDPEGSTVTATAGVGTQRGFQLFPQALDGRLPVAIRQDGPARLDAAIDAASLIAAMQRQGAAPLDVTIVDPDAFLESGRSGLVVGAAYADSVAVNAPLRLSGTRLLKSARATFQVGSDAPFAALEAIGQRGRYVLLLGSWAPGDVAASPVLSHRITDRVTGLGWGALDDDVIVADSGGGTPVSVDSGEPATGADPVGADNSYAKYFAVAIALLLLLLALQVLLALRRERRGVRDTRGEPTSEEPAPLAAVPATPEGETEPPVVVTDDDWRDDEPEVEPRRRWFRMLRRNADYREAWVEERDEDELTSYDVVDDVDDDVDGMSADVGDSLSHGRQPWVHLGRR